MSDGVQIVFRGDISDVVSKVGQIPGEVDRATRKSRRSWEGQGGQERQKGDTYGKLASTGREIEKEQEKQRKQELRTYEERLKFNSAIQADQDKAAAETEKNNERQSQKEDQQTEEWHRKELSRKLKEIGEAKAAEEAAAKAEQQRIEREQKEKNDDYVERLRWNSSLQADQDKQAAAAEKKSEEERQKEEQQTEDWHRKELSRKLKEIKEQRDADEKAAAEDAARKEKETKQSNADYLKRLKWNSKIQEDQDKAAAKAARAEEWTEQFGKALEGTLMRTIGPAAVAAAAIELGWGNVIAMAKNMWNASESKLSEGIDPKQLLLFQRVANVGTATNEQVTAMYSRAQANANALATGAAGGNAFGFQYFGMTDFDQYREKGLPVAELLVKMAKRYRAEGGTPQYGDAAKSIFGDDWKSIKALLALEAKNMAGGGKEGDVMSHIESGKFVWNQYMRSLFMNLRAKQLTQGELMGGVQGGPPAQVLSNVTSLQAMGGGDILSAIARGPQERTATAAENIERNTAEIARKIGNNPVSGQPAIIGR